MPSIDHLQTLFAYHFATTRRLITTAQCLPAKVTAPISDLLFHIHSADRGWRIGLETGQRPPRLNCDEYPGVAAIGRLFADEQVAWGAYLASLDPNQIDGVVEMRSGPNMVANFDRWRVMHHVVLHGMQHHAEIAELLTNAGASPGDIDFIFYGRAQ